MIKSTRHSLLRFVVLRHLLIVNVFLTFGKHFHYCFLPREYSLTSFLMKKSDEYDPNRWNLDGAVDDVQLLYQVGRNLSNSTFWPQWKSTSEFKSTRDAYME